MRSSRVQWEAFPGGGLHKSQKTPLISTIVSILKVKNIYIIASAWCECFSIHVFFFCLFIKPSACIIAADAHERPSPGTKLLVSLPCFLGKIKRRPAALSRFRSLAALEAVL